MVKMIRLFDILFSFLGLVILLPLFAIIYLLITLESRGGGFYLQERVGRFNTNFKLIKFRSMRVGSDKKSLITIGGKDPRLTRTGYYIRLFKIDELPQLFNVLVGDMSIVGPRPEVRQYVELYNAEQLKVLNFRPGITDYASIEFANENELLGNSANPENVYINEIMPLKLALNLKYIKNYNIVEYFKIIFLTLHKIIN